MTQEGPNRPQPERQKLDSEKTAIVVLDLSARCEDPNKVCARLMEPLAEFLERARKASVPILYTISAAANGTAMGEVAAPLKRRAQGRVGQVKLPSSSYCRLGDQFTATTAARIYRYDVVIPLDGVNARRQYEHEYATIR